MDPTVVVALFTFAGVGLSILGSYFITKKTLNLELGKLRFQIEQTYAGELLKKRLEIYPKLYCCVSGLVKDIEEQNISRETLRNINDKFSQMDSQHAILFEAETIVRCIKLRRKLRDLTRLNEQDLNKIVSSSDELRALQDLVGAFELALKSELGVYGFESITSDGELRVRFKNYYDEKRKSVAYFGDEEDKALLPSSRT